MLRYKVEKNIKKEEEGKKEEIEKIRVLEKEKNLWIKQEDP